MRTRSALVRLLVIVLLWLTATAAFAAPRIGVLTMQPGEIFFERFGHNAVVVDDPESGRGPISYNFGFFDLDEPGFLRRFIQGDMQYMLVALPVDEDLAYYRNVGRGVSIQWLDLEPAQARDIADALAHNALPENARYRYDYFTDNCSTRVRDAIDRATNGALRRQLEVRSAGDTYRSEAVRLASPALWMWLGFDIGLGPFADRPLSRWEDAFVPMRLAASLREAKNSEGRPLVAEEHEVLPHRIAPEPPDAPRRVWAWLLAGVLLAIGVRWLATHRPRILGGLALPFWTLCGALGLLMAFIWCCTAHRAGWTNHNLLLFSPLCLLLVPGAMAMLRGREPSRFHQAIRIAVVLGGVLALFLQLPAGAQFQAPWLALLLPLHAALAFPVRRT
ncbi:DUF4105 domain-containing protein [Lysobacter sp. A6]|uniref:DUF4105 domain-containing protein n=1 Tax=Noviluteimonas lactosilytica TaxID=2888523 RepID=A0ABS8JJV5_9GAMM|nr:DUF4105 domain-containing protein [Lysobacter lactosilyticus]MCC8363895.1 DUF4105 domain-containing protein [Lysobacter lactosilyticus]